MNFTSPQASTQVGRASRRRCCLVHRMNGRAIIAWSLQNIPYKQPETFNRTVKSASNMDTPGSTSWNNKSTLFYSNVHCARWRPEAWHIFASNCLIRGCEKWRELGRAMKYLLSSRNQKPLWSSQVIKTTLLKLEWPWFPVPVHPSNIVYIKHARFSWLLKCL